jgi:hypothetical protein
VDIMKSKVVLIMTEWCKDDHDLQIFGACPTIGPNHRFGRREAKSVVGSEKPVRYPLI